MDQVIHCLLSSDAVSVSEWVAGIRISYRSWASVLEFDIDRDGFAVVLCAKNTDAVGELGQCRARRKWERFRSITKFDRHMSRLRIVHVGMKHDGPQLMTGAGSIDPPAGRASAVGLSIEPDWWPKPKRSLSCSDSVGKYSCGMVRHSGGPRVHNCAGQRPLYATDVIDA